MCPTSPLLSVLSPVVVLTLFAAFSTFQPRNAGTGASASVSECNQDILFVLDASSSLSKTTFAKAKDLLKKIGAMLQIGDKDEQRVGLIEYSGHTRKWLRLPFGQLKSNSEFSDIVNGLFHLQGVTLTGRALTAAKEMLSERRPLVTSVVIVVTDGYSHDPIQPIAQQLTELPNVFVYAVSVSDRSRKSELEMITGDISRVFVGDGGQNTILDVLGTIIACRVRPTNTVPSLRIISTLDSKKNPEGLDGGMKSELLPFKSGVAAIANDSLLTPSSPSAVQTVPPSTSSAWPYSIPALSSRPESVNQSSTQVSPEVVEGGTTTPGPQNDNIDSYALSSITLVDDPNRPDEMPEGIPMTSVKGSIQSQVDNPLQSVSNDGLGSACSRQPFQHKCQSGQRSQFTLRWHYDEAKMECCSFAWGFCRDEVEISNHSTLRTKRDCEVLCFETSFDIQPILPKS